MFDILVSLKNTSPPPPSRTHWAPMDVEDALELLGPSWEYHDLRRWLTLALKSSKNALSQICSRQISSSFRRGPAIVSDAAGAGDSFI